MEEYIFNAVRAAAGDDIDIVVRIANDDGSEITENCSLNFLDDNGVIAKIPGKYVDNWLFTIPAEMTQGLKGRYWYCIFYADSMLCHKNPIYIN